MKATPHLLGSHTKDGVRYRVEREPGDSPRAVQEAGYVLDPLRGEALASAIAAHRAEFEARRVPQSVPLWAFRQVLIEDNLLPTILAAVQGNAVLVNFLEYGNFVDRSSPLLAEIATGLGKTDAEVDDLFRRANAIRL